VLGVLASEHLRVLGNELLKHSLCVVGPFGQRMSRSP